MNDNYFFRSIDHHLIAWKTEVHRKPLLIRGARQVGKSSAVRHLGKSFDHFIELNFERNPEIKQLFSASLNPQEICVKLSAIYNVPIKVLKLRLIMCFL